MGKTKKILFVENDIPSVKVIKFYLQNEYEIDYAYNGIDALKLVNEKKYTVILMDIDLGEGMNGLKTAHEIRNVPGYKDIPIVAVTAYAMRGDQENFLANGCTHYISKPFLKNELLSLLKSITSL